MELSSFSYRDVPDSTGLPIEKYAPVTASNNPAYRINDGRLILYLSKSLISKYVKHQEVIPRCPLKNYHYYLLKDVKKPSSASMMKGLYFESQIIGGGATGDYIDDLDRHSKTGAKKIDQIRIDEQVMMFNMEISKRGIVVLDDNSNCQVVDMKKYPKPIFNNIDVWLIGVADLISPISSNEFNFKEAVIDIKLTKSLGNTYGEFAWGAPHLMDHTGAQLYSLLFNMPFFYWVFDFDGKKSNKLIYYNMDVTNSNPEIKQKAMYRISELNESIRKTVVEINSDFVKGFPPNPSTENCKDCKCKCLLKKEIYEL